MASQSLDDLLREELRDLLDGETQITKALPRMAKAVESEPLRQSLQMHLRQTEEQIERLHRAFELLDERPRKKTCHGIKGLIEEAREMMQELDRGPVLDAALIGAQQKVEHYEIAAYGTVRTFATRLGHDEVAALFEETLEEEKATDEKLTEVAESLVNPEAADEDDEDEGASSPRRGRGRAAASGRGAGRASSRGAQAGRARGAAKSSRKK
jgi:ferritin-like metal-binding protein YciE